MIWKLMNMLFGWQYIIAECGYHRDVKIRRVNKYGNKFYYKCSGKLILVKKYKYSNEPTAVPLSMSQEDFDKMVEVNHEKV